jgi:hypothetical protein
MVGKGVKVGKGVGVEVGDGEGVIVAVRVGGRVGKGVTVAVRVSVVDAVGVADMGTAVVVSVVARVVFAAMVSFCSVQPTAKKRNKTIPIIRP